MLNLFKKQSIRFSQYKYLTQTLRQSMKIAVAIQLFFMFHPHDVHGTCVCVFYLD